MRFEIEHPIGIGFVCLVSLAIFIDPTFIAVVVLLQTLVKFPGQTTDDSCVVGVGSAQATGTQTTKMMTRFDQHAALAHAPHLHGRHDTRRRAAIDHHVRFPRGWLRR